MGFAPIKRGFITNGISAEALALYKIFVSSGLQAIIEKLLLTIGRSLLDKEFIWAFSLEVFCCFQVESTEAKISVTFRGFELNPELSKRYEVGESRVPEIVAISCFQSGDQVRLALEKRSAVSSVN